MNCPKCGSPAEEGAKFCSVCGTKLIEDTPAVSVTPAVPEVEIPKPKAPEKKDIELVLPGHEMYEEEAEEEDLSDILAPNKGVETHGNMQAQTEPQIELVLPSETPQQMQARLELERELKERQKKKEAEELRKKKEAEDRQKKLDEEAERKRKEELRKQREAEMSNASAKTERPAAASQQLGAGNPEGLWGVIAYVFLIGFVAAFIKERTTRSEFLRAHVNNALYLNLIMFIASAVNLGFISSLLILMVTVFGIMGMVGAIKGEETELPLISQLPKIL